MDSTSSVPPTERTPAYVSDSAYAGFSNWESGRPQWAFDRIAAAGRSFVTVLDSAMYHLFEEPERERFVERLGAVVPRGESAVRTHVSPLPNGLEVQPVLIELVEILMRVTLDASPAVDSRLRLRRSGGRPTIGADFAVQTRRPSRTRSPPGWTAGRYG